MDIKTFEILEKYCKKEGLKMAVPIQTNEEWFGTLSTEEKAKIIVCLAVNSMHKRQKGLIDSDVGEIVRWLKEKHDSEEK